MGGCAGCSFKGASTETEDSFVGVRFGDETNLTICASGGAMWARGDAVIVKTDDGRRFGRVEKVPVPIFKPCQKSGAQRILRSASPEDHEARERQIRNELSAKLFGRERVRQLGLKMKLSRIDFSLSGKNATFYFTAEKRVDFRQLVRDLAKRFSTRVRMVHVGPRDEAALLGGIGVCGETLCCSTWLKEFRPISIQMAKRQNLSLNPSKISGQCGRLLCCLSYEDHNYRKPKPEKNLTQLGGA